MVYLRCDFEDEDEYTILVGSYHEGYAEREDGTLVPIFDEHIPAWSLTALLNVIPKRIKDYNVLRIDISDDDFAIWYDKIGYGVNNDLPDITKDNPVDACYEIILKLHELKML